MKKKILIVLCCLFISKINMAQIKFGFTAGAQLANVRLSTYDATSRFAFNLGGTALTKLSDDIHLQIQLLLSSKGYKYYDEFGYKNLVKPIYLELPIVPRFKFETGDQTDVYIGAGGYYAFGIGGKQTYYLSGVKESQKLFSSDNDVEVNRSDFGAVFQLGFTFRENYEGHFFYDLGLNNIYPEATTNTFNRVFGFNLTRYFGNEAEQ